MKITDRIDQEIQRWRKIEIRVSPLDLYDLLKCDRNISKTWLYKGYPVIIDANLEKGQFIISEVVNEK